MHDLLEDPLISARLPEGDRKLTLPQLLAELSASRVQAYTRLRRHQLDPFHVMTVQLAAAVLARRHAETPPVDASFWRDGLLALAQGQISAWHMVEADPLKPAFMQSPCSDTADFHAYKPKASTPDELDVLVTAKDHDIKMARIRSEDIEAWLAALVTAQTTCGFLGAGNYGIVRMNGGFGSRAFVSTIKDPRPGPRFCEETPLVVQVRRDALAAAFQFAPNGAALTWLKAWNRKTAQHSFADLDPLFVEAARPLRLVADGPGWLAVAATTGGRQIAGPDNGDCGDAWTVLNVADKKKGTSALTVSSQGLSPKLLTDLLFQQGYQLTSLQRPRPGGGRAHFCVSVLVRGQGTTDGFHVEQIPVPENARAMLLQPAGRDQLARMAGKVLTDASTVERKCLRTALMALALGGPAEVDFGKDTVAAWADHALRAFTQRWHHDYFPTLWKLAAAVPDLHTVRSDWVSMLLNGARQVLQQAEQTVPVPSSRRLRAVMRAQSLMEAGFHKHGLIALITETGDGTHD